MIIPLFSISQQGKSSTVTSQSHINLYAELSQDQDKTGITFYGTPGLSLFADFGDTPHRGVIPYRDFFYTVHRGTFWQVNNAGVRVNKGSLNTTTGRVAMATNGQQIGIVDGTNMYLYVINQIARPVQSITRVGTIATLTTTVAHGRISGETVTVSGASPAQYNGTYIITVTSPTAFTYVMASDPGSSATIVGSYVVDSSFVTITSGLMANPVDITFQDGYFSIIFQNSGQWQITGIYDGSSINPLEFTTAEAAPDDNQRIIADHGEIVVFGTETTEFYGNSGNLVFPYQNIKGAALEFGLAARWSLVKYNDSLAGLFKNRQGQVQVMVQQGHSIQPISTPDIDYLINKYPSVADATAFSYMLGGHPMFQINFPIAGKSWLYDARSGMWTEMQSGLLGMRHKSEIQFDYLNKPRTTDYATGQIYTIQPDMYTDNGEPIIRKIRSKHFFRDFKKVIVKRLTIDFETGVGLISGQGQNPQVMLRVSRDNGKTWGAELWRSMGKIGEYLARVFWTRLGSGRDYVFEMSISDPVKVVIPASSIEVEVVE